jgi:hypothetical protein
MNSTFKKCSCHGISGTCTFSVCHNKLPSFSTLAKKIKQGFDDSCAVKIIGHSRSGWVSDCITDTSLIYTATNDWCQYNPAIGSPGVVGRECSPLPDVENSCNKLCGMCGRPSQRRTVKKVTQCDCQFKFCCEIKCNICTEQRTYYSCS